MVAGWSACLQNELFREGPGDRPAEPLLGLPYNARRPMRLVGRCYLVVDENATLVGPDSRLRPMLGNGAVFSLHC